jgi:hypothetical protein
VPHLRLPFVIDRDLHRAFGDCCHVDGQGTRPCEPEHADERKRAKRNGKGFSLSVFVA